ncbi:hypothetical protein LSCM1_02305 [Leishmania martiniquensis]|uniref:Cyclic nucleotide-binding domain-containing protein n=1 Tax=Leishmania martiniquensis TaxID=1580590 RepID=A0A836H0V5_9TRYP|nr:hypothetical protein LSCM1_02305 [Leishmania martiniquensis]
MSSFDKCVAQVVSNMGERVPKEVRELLLQNIAEGIHYYLQLRGLAAAHSRKEAKTAKKERAAARKAKKQERRRRMERKASLPPLVPSLSKTAAVTAPTVSMPVKKARMGRPTAMKRTAPTSASAPLQKNGGVTTTSAARKAPTRGASRGIEARHIDFAFADEVAEQLRQLRGEKHRKRSSLRGFGPPGTAPACAAPTLAVNDVSAPRPTEAGDPSAQPTKSPSLNPPKRISPPPLNQTAMQESEPENSAMNGTAAVLPVSYSETICYQEALQGYKFGCQDADTQSSSKTEKDSEDEEQANKEAEDEFIDDREDVRRRTIHMQRPSRGAISDSSLDLNEVRVANFPTTPKSQEKLKTISRVLVRHFLFSNLDDSDIAKFASIMDIEEFEAGARILEKGSMNDTFFIVLDGEAETTTVNDDGEEVTVPLVRSSTIGDLSLMYEASNPASVVARSSVQCASLERRTYKMITSRAMEDKRCRYIDFLSSLPMFAGLSLSQLESIAERLKEDSYIEGQRLIAAGVPTHWVHFIMEGTLRVMAPDAESGEMKEVALLHRGDCTGHIEFLYHHVSVADVIVISAVVKTAKLSRRSFELLPSETRERLMKSVEDDETYAAYHHRMQSQSPPPLDTTPPFDAPPSHLRNSLRPHENA